MLRAGRDSRQGRMRNKRFIDMIPLLAALAVAATVPATASAGLAAERLWRPRARQPGNSRCGAGERAERQRRCWWGRLCVQSGRGRRTGRYILRARVAGQAGARAVAAAARIGCSAWCAHAALSRGHGASAAESAAGAAGVHSRPYTSGSAVSAASVGGGRRRSGLSGADLLYIVLALGALLRLTGVLTRKLAQRPEVETHAR